MPAVEGVGRERGDQYPGVPGERRRQGPQRRERPGDGGARDDSGDDGNQRGWSEQRVERLAQPGEHQSGAGRDHQGRRQPLQGPAVDPGAGQPAHDARQPPRRRGDQRDARHQGPREQRDPQTSEGDAEEELRVQLPGHAVQQPEDGQLPGEPGSQRPDGGAATDQMQCDEDRRQHCRASRAAQIGAAELGGRSRQQGGAAGEGLRGTPEALPRGADGDRRRSRGEQQQAAGRQRTSGGRRDGRPRRHQQDRADAQQDLRWTGAQGEGRWLVEQGHASSRRRRSIDRRSESSRLLPVPAAAGACRSAVPGWLQG